MTSFRTARWLMIGGLIGLGACASGPRHHGFSTPESILEQQLLGRGHPLNKRSRDGGMLYYAELEPSNLSGLRVPFDVLKMQCENRGGTFTPSAPPQNSGASLAPKESDTPDIIRDALIDADLRHLFGEFQCSGLGTWVAEIQPNQLTIGKHGSFRVELYLRASEADVQSTGGEMNGSGLPPMAAGPSEGPSLPPPTAAGAAPPPPSSPLDQQPPVPAPTGDKLLADPRPFGISLGSDSPDIFASKLRIAATPNASCSHPAGKGMTIHCWQQPGGSQALALEAEFADVGNGPVVAEFELRYPASAFAWLERNLSNVLGPTDAGESDDTRSWSWLHTTIVLSHAGDDTLVRASHKPTIDRALLPPNTPGRDQLGASRIATPWQLQLGYEPAQLAQSKLRAAGFEIASTGCSDGGSHTAPILTRSCPLRAARMAGLRSAWVRIVDLGDGRPRLAELEYEFENRARADTERELQTQYGAPIPSQGGAEQWWTGPVGITITPNADSFSVRYFHGRLLQIFIQAGNKGRGAEKAVQRQGL